MRDDVFHDDWMDHVSLHAYFDCFLRFCSDDYSEEGLTGDLGVGCWAVHVGFCACLGVGGCFCG